MCICDYNKMRIVCTVYNDNNNNNNNHNTISFLLVVETVSPSLVVFGCVRSLSIVDDYHVKRFRKFFSAGSHSAGITIVWILLQNVSKCYNGNGKNNNVLIIRLIKFIFVFTATFLTFRMIDVLDPDGLLWRKYRLNS